uniref:Putative vacuolar protein n=1 Tax=Triatoma dimidiata TaxID=72491 RepID=A0A0V0G3C3_TRIDM
MYRIESYVTSIILSYVDRYIKNFKRQDAQVSLWEGDGSLHNLDLDLEVLDQELNLPFSFVSGHIHELLIHVPWTRIASEPVKITINTIECIMKLKPPGQESVKKEKKKRSQSAGEENVTPPSYMSSLVNKIICNLSVTCNNLILKYVEEDIVLSMNIKTLSLNTVNSNWLPEFSEITAAHLILRNIISLTDVTICLDKRNASGRIESYLEPLLYKCSLVVRLSRSFQNISTMSAISTRVAIYCDNVTLSISEPQVPMLLRLAMLTKMTMNQPKSSNGSSLLSFETSSDTHSGENDEKYESWTTWMWGFVPYILPTAADGTVFDVEEELKTMHLGSYIKDFTLDLKLVEDGRSWESFMKIKLEGCFMEMTSNTNDWMNIQLGISLATVQPLPQYDIEKYLTCGQLRPNFINGTLFDNPDKGLQQRNWQAHMSALTENVLLERSPAIAVDYLSTIEIPINSWADNFLSEPREKVLVRYVVGPVDVNVTTGLLHRIEVITKSTESYDYPQFSSYTSILKEDSAYNGNEVKYFTETYIPHHVTQFTISEATVRIFCSYSPLGMASKKSKKGLNVEVAKIFRTKQQPHLLLRLKCLDGTYTKPLTPEKLMGLTLRSHINRELVLDSMTKLSAAALKLSAAVLVGETEVIDLIDVHKMSLSFSYNCLFHAEPDMVSMHCVAQLGELTFNSTYPKLLLGINIVNSLNSKTLVENPLYHTTLVQDSMNIMGIPFLKTSINGVRLMFVQSKVNESLKIRIGNMNGNTYFMGENSKPKVLILSAGSTGSMNVLEVVLQRPLTEGSTTPFLMYIKLRQFHINLEQSLFDWLTYRPRPNVSHTLHRWDSTGSAVSRKISSSSLSSLSKKPTEIIEKVVENDPNTSSAVAATSFKDLENKIKWLMKWLEIVVSGDITDLSLSFTSAGTVGSLLFLKIPSISIASSHGKFSIDTDELPVPLVWRKSATSFPWSVDINGVNGYSVKHGGNKEMFLDPFSINCTVAVTSKVIPSMSIAITMHTDTSNISMALCREQICSLAEFLTAVIHVLNVTSGIPVQKKVDNQLDLKFESSDESYSASQSQSTSQAAEPSKDSLKISFWLQWTLAKFSSSLYTTPSKTEPETLKLTLEIEDIILSTDMDINDKVYQKMKIKLGTASVKHYIRRSPELTWKYGSFGGVIMMGHDSTGNDSEFMALTITRALAVNYHAKINTTSFRAGKENARNKTATADSYLVEVDLKLEPLDFVLPPSILGKFLAVAEPLIWRNEPSSTLLLSPAQEAPINQLTTADLPLLYLDIQQIRAFVPALLLEQDDNLNHDCVVLYLEQITVGHDNTNPVNRRILRSDLYNSAQRARVTSLPGSHLEDRQYQLEFSFQISTGKWEELAPHVTGGESEGLVNPAVYWNSDHAPSHHKGACLTPLLSPVKVSLSLAPPIVTAGFVVSGLNFEGYLTTEVDISLNLEQLILLRYLWNEMLLMIPETNEPPIEPIADSGIESVEGSVTIPLQRVSKPILFPKKSSMSLNTVSSSTAINAKGSRHRIQTVPTDLLLIAKSISVKLYSLEQGKTKPLFYICVVQPLASIEKQGDTSIHKASLYDLLIKHGNDRLFTNGRVEPEDFSETLIETKEGDRDPYKGIPPALINVKSTTIGTKLPTIDIDVGRPIKITLKVLNINFLNNVKEMVFNSLDIHSTHEKFDVNRSTAASHAKLIKSNRPSYVSALIIGTNQIMFDFQSQDINARNALFGIGAISGQINFTSSTHIRSNFQIKSVTITLSGLSNHLVMNPLSFTLNASLMWESWAKNTPIISCQILSDVLALEFSNYYIESFQKVYEEFLPLLNIGKRKHEDNSQSEETDLTSTNDESDNEEQLYKDDLQAGAFQFVNNDNQPDLPSAYQVVFPTSTQMSWAYPQPRCITSLTVLPVPFRFSRPEGITMVLQYLDSAGWKTWTEFCLSETKVTEVELPKKLQVASTWRVVMKALNPPLNVQALAASLRVDSVFSPRLIPRTTFDLDIDCCQISLWAGPTGSIKLPPSLRRFCATDIAFIDEYPFATAYFEQTSLKLKTWKDGKMEAEAGCRPRLDILNCRSLQEQCCIQPFQFHCTFSLDYMQSDESNPVLERRITVFSGPMIIYVAPPIGHTITAAVTNSVLLPYVICNDTCFPIRIGQAQTNEDITIHCLQCHFYSWRSSGHKMDLRFSVNLADNKYWSVPVSICNPGNVKLVLTDENGRNMIIIIVVKKLSHIMTQVLISGELIVYNNLDRGVDVRLVATTIAERQRYITVNAGGRAPSIVLSPDAKYNLRLALEGHWSGLVPLYATSNSWLVKIPLQDKKDFLSVWCQIFKDKSDDGRIMVVVSPMYLIKSLLPCDANVLIKTEEFQRENSLKVPGRGATSNLYTPGTTAHHHSLTFHIDGNLPSSLPHVPLSYSAMDGRTPPPPPIPNVDTLIERAELTAGNVWPFLGSQWEGITLRLANQPDTITHVKVRFCGDKLRVANSLLVELLPWALVINTLGLSIALQSTDKFLCALHHFSILAPPPIEGTFYLLIELNDGYHKSNGLQLSDSQAFYKPHVTGLIPVTSHIQVRVQAPDSVIYSTLHSKMVNGVRILHVSASYIVANLSSYDLSVASFSVRKDVQRLRIPSEIFSYAVSLPKQTKGEIRGEPLGEWHELGHGPITKRQLYLIFEHDGLVSPPITVPPDIITGISSSDAEAERDETTLLLPMREGSTINACLSVVFQICDGTTYITVDDKPSSLVTIHNRTVHLLIVARAFTQHGGAAIDEFDDWEWRFMLPGHSCGHYKVPPAPPGTPLPSVVVARADYNNSWSTAISLVPSSGSRLVNLPHSQDLSATVVKIGYTTHLILSHANHSLISASDVRSRLSLNATKDLVLTQSKDQEIISNASSVPQKNEEIVSCVDMNLLYKEPALYKFSITCFLKGITLMLCTDPPGTFHWQEVAALTLDNVGITIAPMKDLQTGAKEITLRTTVWDLQVDNQEFQQGGYDFSVVVLRQGELDRSCFIGEDPFTLVETARNNDPALDLTLILNCNVNPVLQDVSLNLAPLQLYVEDTYLLKLKDDFTKLFPLGLIEGGFTSAGEELSSSHDLTESTQKSPSKQKEVVSDVKPSRCEQSKLDEEKDDLFNVSDEEEGDDKPVNVTPSWQTDTKEKSNRREKMEDTENETDQMVWSENPLLMDDDIDIPVYKVGIPQQVITSTYSLSRPLKLRSLHIAPLDVLVSVHTSTKFYIALDQSPLTFSAFDRTDVVTTPFRLGHAITLHYFLGAIYGTGWALGSLQLLGAPAGLARSVGHGLKSFITMPYKGIMEGPTGFLLGVLHGSAALMKHITAGTLTSVTQLAGSWSRTLDRLTLSPEDLKYAEQMRRMKPQGLAQGIKQGLTEFGVSLLGGVGGLAQQPLEYATGRDGSLVGSLGRGIVGVMARPISGAAELVALTAHGILLGAGWADNHIPKHQAICQGVDEGRESRLKYSLKIIISRQEKVMAITEGTTGDYEPLVVIITSANLYIVTASSAEIDGPSIRSIALRDVIAKAGHSDPTLINICVITPDDVTEKLSQKRIAEYVRESQLALANGGSASKAEIPPSPPSTDSDPLRIYVSPQRRDYFLIVIDLASRHASDRGFPIFGM